MSPIGTALIALKGETNPLDPIADVGWANLWWTDGPEFGEVTPADGDTVGDLPDEINASTRLARFQDVAGTRASTPDSVVLSITGDITLLAYWQPDSWTPGASLSVVAKWRADLAARSYQMSVSATGNLQITTSATGGATANNTSTVIPGFVNGTGHWICASLDVNNGAGSRVANFFVSDDPPTTDPELVTWTQLGATVTTAGVVTIFNSTRSAEIAATADGTANRYPGCCARAQIRSGFMSGVGQLATTTLAGDFWPEGDAVGQVTTVASTGETWTLQTSSHFEVSPTDLVKPTTGNRPQYDSNPASYGISTALVAADLTDLLDVAFAAPFTGSYSIVAVGAIASGRYLIDGTTATERIALLRDAFGVLTLLITDGGVTSTYLPAGPVAGDPHVFAVVVPAAGNIILVIDEDEFDTGIAGTPEIAGLSFGNRSTANGAGLGNLGESTFASTYVGDIRAHPRWDEFVDYMINRIT